MRRTPEEIRQFVREHAAGIHNEDLAAMVNEKFGTSHTKASIADLKYQLGVRSGINAGIKKGEHLSRATEWKKGHVPINKGTKGMFPTTGGATRFKKGQKPHNYLPVGTEVKNTDGYWKVKAADPNIWKMKHIFVWEQEHGPVPEGMIVTFLDGDHDHCTPDNLALISLEAHMRRNQMHLYGSTPELGRAAVATAEIIALVRKRKGGQRKKKTARAATRTAVRK